MSLDLKTSWWIRWIPIVVTESLDNFQMKRNVFSQHPREFFNWSWIQNSWEYCLMFKKCTITTDADMSCIKNKIVIPALLDLVYCSCSCKKWTILSFSLYIPVSWINTDFQMNSHPLYQEFVIKDSYLPFSLPVWLIFITNI